jgi:hypothetical protein
MHRCYWDSLLIYTFLQRWHRSPHPPEVGPDRIQGHPREHRFIHERPAARHSRVYRRKAHRCIGTCSDQVRDARFGRLDVGLDVIPVWLTLFSPYRCNNILYLGSADAVEMTDMEFK